jgi:uncharacterized protein
LVHISEISNRYIKDPNEVLKAGQIVKVKVLSVDLKTKRIALSIKALEAAPQVATRRPQPPKAQQSKPQAAIPQPSVEQKLSLLSSKWKVR